MMGNSLPVLVPPLYLYNCASAILAKHTNFCEESGAWASVCGWDEDYRAVFERGCGQPPSSFAHTNREHEIDIMEYTNCKVGAVSMGYATRILPQKGIMVPFYNNVYGMILISMNRSCASFSAVVTSTTPCHGVAR
mmetsp:Transcript_22892/g.26348  ORF Transcript_22892/g.26348 Transcript_22892/m.26348 type:complete len:136 (+) Transcript_22892:499-906(+)|eukprot:CAMPEP_0194400610 /NCGR_PEP_ID=MMETSP0174-20130528/127329_1 /TAXON_ID=216777 /ORGANISM="Proboscia alata, Strain PI-D3" /LENGTH=135 /DNA_ID=CAMNT_0039197185 /DNA_START=1281 /DNA_END=1688 /DNA_ORIENTATION=-